MVIVQLGRSHAHAHIQAAALAVTVAGKGAESGGHGVEILLGDLIGKEIGRRIGLGFERRKVAAQLFAHRVEKHRGLRRGGRRNADKKNP